MSRREFIRGAIAAASPKSPPRASPRAVAACFIRQQLREGSVPAVVIEQDAKATGILAARRSEAPLTCRGADAVGRSGEDRIPDGGATSRLRRGFDNVSTARSLPRSPAIAPDGMIAMPTPARTKLTGKRRMGLV
jgi:hypothetical protein